jgi:predicted lipoprotein with Yx(FWY)xxD motif
VKPTTWLLVAGLLAVGACGGGDSGSSGGRRPAENPTPKKKPARAAPKPTGTTVVVASSQYGRMLFGANRRAIYTFENDPKGKSVCDGACAEAWPPVLTKGEPKAAKGARQSLLGTTKRSDGRLQATYAGKPLYFYAHEGPGEVRCHNVELNGGMWWVIGPNGKRRP